MNKKELSRPDLVCNAENTLSFLVRDTNYYLIYDKRNLKYKDIEKEYKHRMFGTESSIRFHPCRLCGKSDVENMTSHVCRDTGNHIHASCLKQYLSDSTDEKVLQNKKTSLCPFCENPIDLNEVLEEEELNKYKREKDMQKVRSMRASSLSGYVAKLQKEPEKPRSTISRESSREKLNRHEFVCDLCGKTCQIDYINSKIFVHQDDCCTGGCAHKECLISTLSMHFWRKYEKYYGQRILLLTKAEAKALRREWVCPQCGKALKVSELKSLVTEREWNQQIEMMKKREKPKQVRSLLKKMLEKAKAEGVIKERGARPFVQREARQLIPGEFVRPLKAGMIWNPLNWSKKARSRMVTLGVLGQTVLVLYCCWKYWSSMIKL